MSKTSHNKTFFGIVMACMLGALLIGFVTWLSSCNTPKRAERLIDKGNRIDKTVLPKKCAELYNPISGKDSIVIYKAGEEIIRYDTLTFVDIMNDTVYRYVNKYITKHDTLQTTKTVTVHNEAKEQELSAALVSCKETVSGQKSVLNICYWTIGILGIYTLGRWILRIWKIKLP